MKSSFDDFTMLTNNLACWISETGNCRETLFWIYGGSQKFSLHHIRNFKCIMEIDEVDKMIINEKIYLESLATKLNYLLSE